MDWIVFIHRNIYPTYNIVHKENITIASAPTKRNKTNNDSNNHRQTAEICPVRWSYTHTHIHISAQSEIEDHMLYFEHEPKSGRSSRLRPLEWNSKLSLIRVYIDFDYNFSLLLCIDLRFPFRPQLQSQLFERSRKATKTTTTGYTEIRGEQGKMSLYSKYIFKAELCSTNHNRRKKRNMK